MGGESNNITQAVRAITAGSEYVIATFFIGVSRYPCPPQSLKIVEDLSNRCGKVEAPS
jgi:hypothetical protein